MSHKHHLNNKPGNTLYIIILIMILFYYFFIDSLIFINFINFYKFMFNV